MADDKQTTSETTNEEKEESVEVPVSESVVAEEQPEQTEPAEEAVEELAQAQAAEEALPAEEIGFPDLRPGMTIRLYHKIKEGEKERTQMFQGIIIALRGATAQTKTVTVQKNSFGVMVEKIFPLSSPLIEKIEVVKKAKVRRAKLYYLQSYGKRLKEVLVKQ